MLVTCSINDDRHLLFSSHPVLDCLSDIESSRDVESHVKYACTVLSLGQRCSDWFILCKFLVIGALDGKLLLADPDMSFRLGMIQFQNQPIP